MKQMIFLLLLFRQRKIVYAKVSNSERKMPLISRQNGESYEREKKNTKKMVSGIAVVALRRLPGSNFRIGGPKAGMG